MAKTISISNPELLIDAHRSSLSSSGIAASGTISLYSISNFAVNQILLIGEFGQEGSEIIKTHAATAPTGTTVTLASNLVKSHPKDTPVYILPYDQVQFYHSTTETGDKTLLSTSGVDEENTETLYNDTAYSSGYYFTRFYNSISTDYSDYSDAIPYGGLGSNSVGYIINLAMKQTKKQFTEVLTYETLLDEINACLRYVRGKLKRWSNVQEFDYVLTEMDRGEYRWSLPTTYYDKNSNRSCLGVRVGDKMLDYMDWIEFKNFMEDVHHTTLSSAASEDDTTLNLTDASDFDSAGTVHIYSANTLYTVTYTGKTATTLTGCSGVDATLASGLDVWQGESEGKPDNYTIADGYLYIWPLINSTHQGENIYMDFYTDIVEVDSDADQITLARHDMVRHWLKWQIRNITENNGQPNFKDGDWLMFSDILKDAVRRESSGQKFKMRPVINGIYYKGEQNDRNATFENQ